MKKKCLVAQIFLSLVILASCATTQVKNGPQQEAVPIYFSGEIPFRDVSRIKAEVVAQCKITENMLAEIDARSKKIGLPITDQSSPRELSIEIIHASPGVSVFGNFGSVPATLSIAFTVTESEKVLHRQNRSCKTNLAGFLGLQSSACNKIEKCARNQGQYVVERISRILYR